MPQKKPQTTPAAGFGVSCTLRAASRKYSARTTKKTAKTITNT